MFLLLPKDQILIIYLMIDLMIDRAEHEKCFITSEPGTICLCDCGYSGVKITIYYIYKINGLTLFTAANDCNIDECENCGFCCTIINQDIWLCDLGYSGVTIAIYDMTCTRENQKFGF